MKKYLDRSCTEQERDELINRIRSTKAPEEMDVLWKEAWRETGDQVRYEELSWEHLLEIDARKKQPQSKVLRLSVLRWAGAAAVIIGIFFMAKWWTQGEDFMIYETGFGENIEFVLDDGTRINLNANSRLEWNNDWEKAGIRTVNLDGEAYFDVAHLEQQIGSVEGDDNTNALPFEVNTADLTIRVLGTSFNAIERRGKTEVFLEEGAVELALHGRNKTQVDQPDESLEGERKNQSDITHGEQGAFPTVVKMLPGEWVSYSAEENELVQKTIDKTEPFTEWKDGTLSYQDVEFSIMLQNLEDIYGKTFHVIDSTLLQRRVKFGVPYENWEAVKDMMGWMLGIEVVELEENQVRIEKRKEN